MNRRKPDELVDGAIQLLLAAGLERPHAVHLAQAVVTADLFGYTSHGLALLPRYLDELGDGRMAKSGTPEIVQDNGSNMTIDGRLLPGAAVVNFALDHLLERLSAHGAAVAVVRRSQHIGCLSAYLERATAKGSLILIMSSNPHAKVVAPFGGTRPAYSPNPIACGIPTSNEPILIDMSMSSISVNRAREYREQGQELPDNYLFGSDGRATSDPNALFGSQPGAIRPFGGTDLGYKGFALGLIVEAFTAGLGGFGRSDLPSSPSNSVFIFVADPDRFGGGGFLRDEMTALVASCRAAVSLPTETVRLPGERALVHRREALRDGVMVSASVAAALAERARKLGVNSIFADH
jgi:LDH2 family malate/lactate/ureidoglycolate dehydrogenase